jgi:hypothetical protein
MFISAANIKGFATQVLKSIGPIRTLLIGDAIANGETGKAPTQNAVYDALALKVDGGSNIVTLATRASAPSAPASGYVNLYVLTADGKLYIQNSSDTKTVVGTQS